MTGLLAPDVIDFHFEDGTLEYEERIDVSGFDDESTELLIERTKMGIGAFAGDTEGVSIEQKGDWLVISYIQERSPELAAATGATELLMAVAKHGGDIDRPWHIVKALGPQHIPEFDIDDIDEDYSDVPEPPQPSEGVEDGE